MPSYESYNILIYIYIHRCILQESLRGGGGIPLHQHKERAAEEEGEEEDQSSGFHFELLQDR